MKKATLFVPPEKEGGFDQLLSKDWKDRRHDPFETWPCLFIDAMFDNLEEQTQLYATRDKGNDNFYQIRSKVYQFIGIIFISGYHRVLKERNYRPSQIDIHVPLIANARTLRRYLQIRQCLEGANKRNLVQGSEATKNKPLYDAFRMTLKQFGILHGKLSIDQTTVPRKGLYSIHQFLLFPFSQKLV